MTDRGIRNNDPFNIDFDPKVVWQGSVGIETGVPNPRFVAFKTAQYGIRAGAKTLLTYQNHDGCKTLRQIITRFAPGVENNTAAYIAAVCAGIGIGPDDEINVDSVAVMTPLANAIIAHENSGYVYPPSVVAEGIRMAGVADAPPPKLATQKPFMAQMGGAVALAGAGATQLAQYAPTVKSAADQLSDYTGSPIIQHAVTFLLTVAGGLTLVGIAAAFLKQRSA